MRSSIGKFLLAASLAGAAVWAAEESSDVRTIRLRQDDAQVRFISKIYELKNVSGEELLPFVNSAIQRYNRSSSVRRVTGGGDKDKCNALLVSTGVDFMPYVDKIVAALDRPGKTGDDGSVIQGTGVAQIAYTPRYRAASQFSEIIDKIYLLQCI